MWGTRRRAREAERRNDRGARRSTSLAQAARPAPGERPKLGPQVGIQPSRGASCSMAQHNTAQHGAAQRPSNRARGSPWRTACAAGAAPLGGAAPRRSGCAGRRLHGGSASGRGVSSGGGTQAGHAAWRASACSRRWRGVAALLCHSTLTPGRGAASPPLLAPRLPFASLPFERFAPV